MKYTEMTLEDCFVNYFTNKVASEFDADNKEIILVEE